MDFDYASSQEQISEQSYAEADPDRSESQTDLKVDAQVSESVSNLQ